MSDIVQDLQQFMFTSKNCYKLTKKKAIFDNNNNNNNNNKKENKKNIPFTSLHNNNETNKPEIFDCVHKDSLFWCFYIIKNGIHNYEMINNQHFSIEKETKYQLIQDLRSNKEKLKLHKIKPLYELEDELANKETMNLKTFIAICIINNINIIVLENNKMYEFIQKEDTVFILNKVKDINKYTLDLHSTEDKINNYRKNYYKMENLDVTIKAISYYKVNELNDIAVKLNIDLKNNLNKKISKKEIYEEIVRNLT